MLSIPKVAQYARFSSDNQRSESIDAQIRAMNQFCKQNHWQVVSTYTDEARSATTDNRPQFQQMIADSGKGLFDIVLVHKLDRFSRDRYDSAIYKKKLKKKPCQALQCAGTHGRFSGKHYDGSGFGGHVGILQQKPGTGSHEGYE